MTDFWPAFWLVVGVTGGIVFYGRFYVQWIVSERRNKSVMPIVFWYMSGFGSVLLLAYAVQTRSPVGALGQSFNLVVYTRNLIHIRRERGVLTPKASVAIHGAVGLVVAVSAGLALWTWVREWRHTQEVPVERALATWCWLAVGVAGQICYALRFIVQWIATERAKKSVIPTAFWQLSAVAALLLVASFVQRREWVFAIGVGSTLLIYLRNLWLIRNERLTKADGETLSV